MREAAAPSLAVFALAAVVLSACSSTEPAAGPEAGDPAMRAAVAREHEPYTSTYEILVASEVVGYLVAYDAVPIHAMDEVERTLPSGTRRIQDLEFVDVGYISPSGDVRRYAGPDPAQSLGVRKSVTDGLSLFFDGRRPVRLRPLSIGGPAKVH